MSSLSFINGADIVLVRYDTEIGPRPLMIGGSFGRQRLSSEPVGSFTLTLKNIAVGSEYAVLVASTNAQATGGSSALGVVPGSAGTLVDLPLTLDLFAAGNPNNTLLVRVRKGTASVKYLPFETQALAQAGTVVAYINQIQDSIA